MAGLVGDGRVSYPAAGAAMRSTLRAAAHVGLGVRDRAVLDAVLALTVSYSKVCDTTTTRQIAEIAYGRDVHGRERERVRESLNKLHDVGLITITPYGRGRSARVVVSIPTKTPLDPGGDLDVVDVETPPAAGKNTPSGATETPPVGVADLEDLEEFREGKPLALKEEGRGLDRHAKAIVALTKKAINYFGSRDAESAWRPQITAMLEAGHSERSIEHAISEIATMGGRSTKAVELKRYFDERAPVAV